MPAINLHEEASLISKNILFIKKNIVTPKEMSFEYLSYRISRPILKAYYWIFKTLYRGRPWTSPGSIFFFDKVLNKNMVGFEYGSGKSTIYFANKLSKLISVEHYKPWYNKVYSLILNKAILNIEYRYIPTSTVEKEAIIDFRKTHNLDASFNVNDQYYNYFQVINEYPNNFFDFVLVDGRARVECVLNAIKKIKKNGILVLDNSERTHYKPLSKHLQSWPNVTTTTGLTDTTIWIKP